MWQWGSECVAFVLVSVPTVELCSMRWFSAGLHPMGDLSLWSTCTFSAQRQHEMIRTEMDMAVSPPQLLANECKCSTRVCDIHSNVQTEVRSHMTPHAFVFLHLAESCAAVRQIAAWHYRYSEGWKCTEQGKQASHYNRHLATNTSITAAEQGWRCACTHLRQAAIQDNEIQYAKSLEFQQEQEEKKKKTRTLPLSHTEESRATGTVYILPGRVSSSEDVLWFFCSPAETMTGPFSTIIFTTDMGMTSLPQRWSALSLVPLYLSD